MWCPCVMTFTVALYIKMALCDGLLRWPCVMPLLDVLVRRSCEVWSCLRCFDFFFPLQRFGWLQMQITSVAIAAE